MGNHGWSGGWWWRQERWRGRCCWDVGVAPRHSRFPEFGFFRWQKLGELEVRCSRKRKGRTGNVNPVPAGVLQRGSVPKNGHEFAREFKRAGKTPEEKIAWLAGSIPEEAYASIFRVELDAEILQALILTM